MGWSFIDLEKMGNNIRERWFRSHQKIYYSTIENCALSFLIVGCMIACMIAVDELDTGVDILKCIFDSFVPTAITFVMGIVLHNFYVMHKENIFLYDDNQKIIFCTVVCLATYIGYRLHYQSVQFILLLLVGIVLLFVPVFTLCASINKEVNMRYSAVGNKNLYRE